MNSSLFPDSFRCVRAFAGWTARRELRLPAACGRAPAASVTPRNTSRPSILCVVTDMIVWPGHPTHTRKSTGGLVPNGAPARTSQPSVRRHRSRSSNFFPSSVAHAGSRANASRLAIAVASPIAAAAQAQTPVSPSAAIFSLQGEALAWLQGLVKINTVNPPGNEVAAAKYIADILQKNGIPSEMDRKHARPRLSRRAPFRHVPSPILRAPCS